MLETAQHPPEEYIEHKSEEFEKRLSQNASSLGSGFAIIVVGYPGAGKTAAAVQFKSVLAEETGTDVPNIDLNSFADISDSNLRGDEDFVDAVIERKSGIENKCYAIIDGAASFEEIERFANYYDEISIIYITAHHLARHSRLIEDAEDESKEQYSREGLKQRDNRAAECGLAEIEQNEFFDYEIENVNEELSQFEKYCRYVARDVYQDYLYQ